MERVVLNALTKTCGFAAGYLRLRRIKTHRPAAAGRSTFAPVCSDSDKVRRRNHDAGKIRPLTSPKPTR